jgi:hypothetical protein
MAAQTTKNRPSYLAWLSTRFRRHRSRCPHDVERISLSFLEQSAVFGGSNNRNRLEAPELIGELSGEFEIVPSGQHGNSTTHFCAIQKTDRAEAPFT